MLVDVRLIIFLFGAIILLLVITVSLIISYLTTTQRLKKLETNEEELYKKTIEKEKDIVERAQSDYESTIKNADDKASEILKQATKINNDSEKSLNTAVAGLAEKEKEQIDEKTAAFLKTYEAQLSKINDNSINQFKNISENIIKSVDSHFEELRKLLSEQTVESKKVADEKIQAEYEKLEVELKTYKAEQLKKLDNNIYQTIFSISKQILGSGINFDQHQELIMDALAKAKKEIEQ